MRSYINEGGFVAGIEICSPASSMVILVPTWSPDTSFAKLPFLKMSNTSIGSSLSIASDSAVESSAPSLSSIAFW